MFRRHSSEVPADTSVDDKPLGKGRPTPTRKEAEAAANVVKHSGADDQYEVHLVIENNTCEIRVVDSGRGFDSDNLGVNMAGPSEERGRGMALMAALVDSVRFESRPEAGTIVHLVKDLALRPDGPLRRLVEPTAS